MTVRLGILSAAHAHADHYAEALAHVDDAHLVAIADDDTARADSFADRHDIDNRPTEDVLDLVDGVIVCAPNNEHGRWIEAAADADVPILTEKPLATSVDEARSLVTHCDRRDVHLGVAMPVRFSPPVRMARETVKRGKLGRLRAIVGTNLLTWIRPGTWITDPDLAGGGAIMDHTVHVIDLVRWITGVDVVDVYAVGGTQFSDLAVEDVDVLSMELSDGTIVTHDGSWRQPESWDFWGDLTLRLIGEDRVLDVDCFDQVYRLTTDGKGIDRVHWGTDINVELLRDFVAAIRNNRSPAVPGSDGIHPIKVVEAAYESIDRGEAVTVQR